MRSVGSSTGVVLCVSLILSLTAVSPTSPTNDLTCPKCGADRRYLEAWVCRRHAACDGVEWTCQVCAYTWVIVRRTSDGQAGMVSPQSAT